MADKKMQRSREYRELLEEMMRELNLGCQPDEPALNQLRQAKKTFMFLAKNEKPEKMGGKRKRNPDEERKVAARLNATIAIWKTVLSPFTLKRETDKQGFENLYTMHGAKGYEKFMQVLKNAMSKSVDNEEGVSKEVKASWKADWERHQGWIYNVAQDMTGLVWKTLVTHLKEPENAMLGIPASATYKQSLLESWSNGIKVARAESNVKYGNKVINVGPIAIDVATGGSRVSRCVPEMRSLHFLKPEQIVPKGKLGTGVQGEVILCHIRDCPLIPKEVTCVAKRFKDGDKHKRRADALQEVLMGGLNHRGIVGAVGLTIEDPPRLVYDYYNGGDLGSFIDRCDAWRKGRGKDVLQDADRKFVFQRKLFLENRLGIAMALLETMQFLHDNHRVHCDLHFGNILLHFEYDDDIPVRIYVAICDFGMSKHLSQCQLKEQHIWAIPLDKVAKYRKDFPQLAPELVGLHPASYSKRTDVYSMGNIFETLLQAKDNWDGMSMFTRYIHFGWNAPTNHKRLEEYISLMMDGNPEKRMDCSYWVAKIHTAFPDCKLRPYNSPYLLD